MVDQSSKKQQSEIRRFDLTDHERSHREQRVSEIGMDILRQMHAYEESHSFSATERLMEWAMQDPGFKVQLFRFVDTLPVLQSSSQIYDYLNDFLLQPEVRLPVGVRTALRAGRLFRPAVAVSARQQIRHMAKRFIAGSIASEILPVLKQQWDKQVAFSIDLLGEECLSDDETELYQERYMDLISQLSEQVKTWAYQPVLEEGYCYRVPRTNLSIKISSLITKVDPADFEGSLRKLDEAIKPILLKAEQCDVFINFDMESYAIKELTIEFFKRCCEKYRFHAGIALQAYLKSAEKDAQQLIDFAKRSGRQITVRLVKGAYWDYEVINADQMGWPIPVWEHKYETDACFERVAEMFLKAVPRTVTDGGIHLALGSHNVRSIAAAITTLDELGLPHNAIELQMLYGMADSVKAAVNQYGLRLREYVPVGEFLPGMAYLVRRLLENTSNESWLRAGDRESLPDNVLLESPHEIVENMKRREEL